MSFSLLFNLANLYVFPFWICMALLPNRDFTKKLVSSYLIFLPLIGVYIYYLVATFNIETVALLSSPQLENIARFLSQEGSAGAAWVHFLAMDLFVGRWIYWQGREKQLFTTHSLLLCFFFGPVGILSHLITSWLLGKQPNSTETTEDVSAA